MKLLKQNALTAAVSILVSVAFVGLAAEAATTISTNIVTAGTLSVTGLSTLSGGATTTSLTLLNGETVSNATDGTITFGTSSNGQTGYFETVTNSFSHTTQTGLSAATVPTRNTATAKAGPKKLTTTTDVLVNVDDEPTRRVLNHHRSVGQYVVTAVTNRTAAGTVLTGNS